jgi:hypothetical protein
MKFKRYPFSGVARAGFKSSDECELFSSLSQYSRKFGKHACVNSVFQFLLFHLGGPTALRKACASFLAECGGGHPEIDDDAALKEMGKLVKAGAQDIDAAKQVAPQAGGGGTPASKATRLLGKFRKFKEDFEDVYREPRAIEEGNPPPI